MEGEAPEGKPVGDQEEGLRRQPQALIEKKLVTPP
jgi:hypothetical protein